MSLTLLAPVTLAEAAGQLARQRIRLPGLEALCERGPIAASGRSLDDIAAAMIGIRAAEPAPIAPLRLATENGDWRERARSGGWSCVDPVATTLLTDDAQVESRVTDLARAESDALLDALNAEFTRDGLQFFAPDPTRFYVRSDAAPSVSTTPLWQSIGRSMRRALPAGADGAAWRARMNEAQMLLYTHPVNVARDERGAVRVASLWLWGGGSWPEFDPPQIDHIAGGPCWLRTAAESNGVTALDATAVDLDSHFGDPSQRTLIVASDDWEASQDTSTLLADWDRRWFSPLATALASRRLDSVSLMFAADPGSLSIRCGAAAPPPRLDWRRWLGKSAKAPAPTLEESLRTLAQ